MIDLVESIISEDYVSASEIFESRLEEIMEQKLYEMKKHIQAEAVGGLTLDQINARKRLGWKKASDVLPDPRDIVIGSSKSTSTPKKKPAVKRKKKLEEAPMLPPPRIQTPGEKKEIEKLKKGHAGLKSADERRAAGREGQPYKKPEPEEIKTKEKTKPSGGLLKTIAQKLTKKDDKDLSRKQRLAQKGITMLKSPNATMDAVSRYQADIKKAKGLEARGAKGAVSRVKWSSGGMKARASREAGNFTGYVGGTAKRILQGLGEENT